MLKYRLALAVPGAALLVLGVLRLVTDLPAQDLLVLAVWLGAAVAVHDGLVAPLTIGAGLVLVQVPPRARRYAQGALVTAGLITVVAVPLIGREGTQPRSKAILLRDYAGNLTLLLAITAAVAALAYALRVVQDKRRGRALPVDDATS